MPGRSRDRRPRAARRLPRLALAAALLLAGCGGSHKPPGQPSASLSSPSSAGSSLAGDGEQGSSPASSSKPRPTPTGPVVVGSVTERVVASCPYIGTEAAQDAEGNMIGTVSVLSVHGATMGCRFRFAFADNHYTLEITSARYADPTAAYNAMVQRGRAGHQTAGVPGLAPGVDGVLYQTSFYPPDGPKDWACSFAKGATMVTVKTDQTDTSQDAENIARLIVSRF